MAGGREARHVAAEFGDDHLGRAPGDAGNRVEPGERVGVGRGERRDMAIVGGDGVVEELENSTPSAAARRASRACMTGSSASTSAIKARQ